MRESAAARRYRPLTAVALVASLAVAISVTAPGCASTKPGARAREGVQEYRQLTLDASNAVVKALQQLDKVGAQPSRCPPELVQSFSREVDQLQVESVRVRSRAKAIQARGDAYFDDWYKGALKDQPTFRDEDIAMLRVAFTKLKLASNQTGQAFDPFFQSLRKLRVDLETNPESVQTAAVREEIHATRENGREVLARLGSVTNELDAVAKVLSQAKPKT